MRYRGTIIEESLADKHVLESLRIIATRVEPVTPAHQTPWLKHWTLHTVEIPEADAVSIAEQFSRALEISNRPGGNWYVDFKNDATHYIIFPRKTFRINCAHSEQYRLAVEYGISLGIPDYQLDFSPTVKDWERSAQPEQ